MHGDLTKASAMVPAGAWAIGVSGGADSVALLSLLCPRGDLSLHVVHLDHQMRGEQSTEDAQFVAELAIRRNLPFTSARRDQIEPELTDLPANPSARFRAMRMHLFAEVVANHALQGVILAHHADDQAETVLQRLLRGSGAMGLGGMSPRARVARVLVLRPLLPVRRKRLREYLNAIDEPWRIDSSNESPGYLRNRLRVMLARHPALVDALIGMSQSYRALREWVNRTAPRLDSQFYSKTLAMLPELLARESARRWLIDRAVPPDQIDPSVLQRLVSMSRDAASATRMHFPGAIAVRRRRGVIFADTSAASPQRSRAG